MIVLVHYVRRQASAVDWMIASSEGSCFGWTEAHASGYLLT